MGKINVDRVEIRNFLSYGNQWTDFEFQRGINVVLGYDKDKERSNGAGKTSFLEAIPFALFGQINKGIALPKIVNWRNGKQCEVRLHFRKDGIPYIIHRGIKPGTLTLFKDGVEVPKLSDKRLFQAELENDLIGMDFKAAQALLFQNANNMVSLFNTPKADKRRFIEKFFNLEIYSKATEVTNKKLAGVEKRLSEIVMETSFDVSRIRDLSDKIASFVPPDLVVYEGNVTDIQTQIAKFDELNHDLPVKLTSLTSKNTDLLAQRGEIDKSLNESKHRLGDVRLEIRTMQTEASTKRQRITAIGDLSEQTEKLGKVRGALLRFEDVSTKLVDWQKVCDSVKEELAENKAKLREITVIRDQCKKEIGRWESMKTTDATECPTCFQEVDQEHIKDHIQSKLGGLTHELTLVLANITTIEGSIKDTDERFLAASQNLVEHKKRSEQKVQLEQALAKLSGVEEKAIELVELESRVTEIETDILPKYRQQEIGLVEQIESIQGQFDAVSQELVGVDGNIDRCRESIRVREQLSRDLDNAEKILKSQKDIFDRLVGENEANIASKTSLEAKIVSTQSEIKKLETMKDYLEHIKFTLKDENVKQYAISSIIPYLQQQQNHYLAETGHNYYVELDSWLDGTIKGFGVGDCDFGNMSGGEGKSIDLSLKFAMMDVARRQAGSYLDILVLDELLDSSIDSFGLEKTMDIVRLKQREDDLKVYIVSHREEVGAFEADNIYQVTKENGMSTIERVRG